MGKIAGDRGAVADLRRLREVTRLDRGLTVFDAETQDTSYGILWMDEMPHIFDTHRKDDVYVSTVEILTELERPVEIPPESLKRLLRVAERLGLLPIPYSACFFKGNLHVYASYGPIRGLDFAAAGVTVAEAEWKLRERATALWPIIPPAILRAQRDLLMGRRKPRHVADLEALQENLAAARRG